MNLTMDFQGEILKKICVIGMGGQIDMEKTGFESIGCWTHVVTVFTKIIGHVGHFRWLGPNV